jgi:hypothetical protein
MSTVKPSVGDIMRYAWTCACALLLAACAGGDDAGPSAAVAPPPQRQGPQFVNHETVDWTPLDPIVALRLEGLHGTSRWSDSSNPPDDESETIELKIFPGAKSIALDAVPFANASSDCTERGQNFQVQFVASPGADVSDRVTCVGQNFTRYQITLDYATTSKLSAGMLTIDGKARIVENHMDDRGRPAERDDYAIDLHGVIQISSAGCRVLSWRHDFPFVMTSLTPGGSSQQKLNTLTAAADTSCTVVSEKNAG